MEAALHCHSDRAAGSTGTFPRALTAQGGAGCGVLADPFFAGVHERGDLGDVRAAFGIADFRELFGPGGGRKRDEGAGATADAGVDDGGDIASSLPTG
ncbi:MAG TPA: hypothetical protein VHU91_05325 [Mycobacteriales bacterium]|nr:hypothetical protein [Mycobacteriales bacterium]